MRTGLLLFFFLRRGAEKINCTSSSEPPGVSVVGCGICSCRAGTSSRESIATSVTGSMVDWLWNGEGSDVANVRGESLVPV
jgi:hypothetical protein